MPRTPRPQPYLHDPANVELRGIRQSLGLTQNAFCALLGYTRCNLHYLETGRVPVRPGILRLARYIARDADVVAPPPPIAPPDPASVGLHLTPASHCDWHELRCRGPWWHMKASLNTLTHVETTVCDYHLNLVYDLVVTRLRQRRSLHISRKGPLATRVEPPAPEAREWPPAPREAPSVPAVDNGIRA